MLMQQFLFLYSFNMLIKEYRIPLPVTVDEYRIAQLYMIAKKSREESKGAGSGVEILINEPYTDGPGGNGQYTRKIYHVGSHLPSWIKALLPKSALITEEESWNAYPYTKTRFTCPFVEKFSIEIETYYLPDNGYQENVFQLTGSDLRNRIIDIIDILEYNEGNLNKDEDPRYYVSKKSKRGPLSKNWIDDYWMELEGKKMPLSNGKAIMCAYKLCKVEFRYWGMQTKLEKFIHDVALRRTMLQAHLQAWIWQDEWHGLSMEDIREIERQTQADLRKKMCNFNSSLDNSSPGSLKSSINESPKVESSEKAFSSTLGSIEINEDNSFLSTNLSNVPDSNNLNFIPDDQSISSHKDEARKSHKTSVVSANSHNKLLLTHANNYRMESIVRNSDTDSEDEFFDCQDKITDVPALSKWSSLELLSERDINPDQKTDNDDSIFSPSYLKRVASDRKSFRNNVIKKRNQSIESVPSSPHRGPCSTTILLIVLHSGSVLDANFDNGAKKSDITTFRGAFESIMRQHYSSLVGHIAIKLVSCSSICNEALGILASLSPYSFDVSPFSQDISQITHDSIPIGSIPLLATCISEYKDIVEKTIISINAIFQEFLKSEEGSGFNGQVYFIGDSMGSIIGYDILSKTPFRSKVRHNSENSVTDIGNEQYPNQKLGRTLSNDSPKLDFEVTEFFTFGSPLSLVLAYRKILNRNDVITRPNVQQVYNLFHPTDPIASRLEPLLSARFAYLPPINVPRYVKYPLGNGQLYHLLEVVQNNPQIFSDKQNFSRRLSDISLVSVASGVNDSVPLQALTSLQQKWWGNKRLDYALYCPEGLANFSTNALPHLFHASYWESSDVIAFILRQVGRFDNAITIGIELEDKETCFKPKQPREKWNRKRTSVKLKNVAANHRANDVIVKEGMIQMLTARFMYGPLDMITLTGEKIDIHIMRDFPSGDWFYLSTEITDKTGRVTYTIPESKTFGYGLYPIKMVVRGDHTSVDFFLAVVPPKTECIVFSIDGSFTASVSVTGRDPKVRAGAVDVVRHWQELGYLIIYITGRPDMQQHKVVSWLSQHNFPHGLVSFADGLSTDPLGHKAAYLSNLIRNHELIIHAAYGSSKDITVYQSINLDAKRIYIVGSASKKQQNSATVLTEGYVSHLNDLMAYGGSRPAQGNARMVLPRGYFSLPGQKSNRRRSHELSSNMKPSSCFSKRKVYVSHV